MYRIMHAVILIAIFFLTACSITRPVAITSNPVSYVVSYKGVEKPVMGKATQIGLLFFPPMDVDGGIWKAVENGGIKKISSVDYKISWYLFFTKWETIVTGER